MSLEVVRHSDARALLQRAEPWLLRSEAEHNLILSLSYEVAREGADGYFATVELDGGVQGCVFRAPPHQVLLTEMPPAGPSAVARAVAGAYEEIPGVLGPPTLAEAFARAWSELRGVSYRPGADQRLYRLDRVTPLPADGRMRPARLDEVGLAVEWAEAFSRDVHQRFGPGEERLGGWIADGYVFIWEDGGTPVSMALAHGRTPAGVRVGYVYTPPERRRRGYAGALVATLSQHMLDHGYDFCVLYADLSNPTTNALYQRMGYRPLTDVRDYHFHPEDHR